MKKIFTLIAAAGLFTAAMAQQTTTPTPVPAPVKTETVKWSETTHNFGNIKMGGPAEAIFTFTNLSNAPVTVVAANPSCGCTTPSYTTTEVPAGKTGTVKASYGTDGRPGSFTKTVTARFSNGAESILTITGNVITETTPEPANTGGGSQ